MNAGQRNHGAFLLMRTGATEEAIAEVGGVTKVAAHYWRTSESKPTKAKREILERVYGIPVPAWDEVPPAFGSAAPPVDEPPDVTEETFEYNALTVELKRHAQDLLRGLRTPAAGSTPTERAKVMRELAGVVNTLAKTDKELARRVFASPQWSKLERKLAVVLAKHPDAAHDVELAIETMIAEDEYG